MAYTGDKKRQYDREWVANRRASWLADKCCVVCGIKERLEVHHINPADKVTHKVWSWAEERRNKELAKCEVRCHEHHRDITGRAQHGTASKYRAGCRCRPCRDGHATAYRKWYHSRVC